MEREGEAQQGRLCTLNSTKKHNFLNDLFVSRIIKESQHKSIHTLVRDMLPLIHAQVITHCIFCVSKGHDIIFCMRTYDSTISTYCVKPSYTMQDVCTMR